MAHRTALITAALIAAVVLAGVAAIGVNLGILNAADASKVGQLSATAPQAWAVTSEALAVSSAAEEAETPQRYVVEKAGTVDVLASQSGLHVVDVNPRRGWTYRLVQTADKRVVVTFKRRATTYTFIAKLAKDGSIRARVDRPVTKVVIVPSAPRAASSASTTAAQRVTPVSTRSGDAEGENEHEGDDGHEGEADDD